MDPKDREKKDRPERRDAPERTGAPPIEREHETYQGVLEEEERREHAEERH